MPLRDWYWYPSVLVPDASARHFKLLTTTCQLVLTLTPQLMVNIARSSDSSFGLISFSTCAPAFPTSRPSFSDAPKAYRNLTTHKDHHFLHQLPIPNPITHITTSVLLPPTPTTNQASMSSHPNNERFWPPPGEGGCPAGDRYRPRRALGPGREVAAGDPGAAKGLQQEARRCLRRLWRWLVSRRRRPRSEKVDEKQANDAGGL
ncbi:hypothetical protein GE09DRAFT_1103753 [Coniochaeta sp. 2T2.1]|nr:hypothetical protein GE09DRAFT_1103753 [Coniochaeta sp. 2T2.1]